MPAKYRIDKSLGVVFTTVRGVFTGQDVLTHGQRLLDDPDFDPSYNHLIDLRDVIEIGISPHEMESITTHKHIFSQKSRRAIVAETDFKFAMSRMYGPAPVTSAVDCRFIDTFTIFIARSICACWDWPTKVSISCIAILV